MIQYTKITLYRGNCGIQWLCCLHFSRVVVKLGFLCTVHKCHYAGQTRNIWDHSLVLHREKKWPLQSVVHHPRWQCIPHCLPIHQLSNGNVTFNSEIVTFVMTAIDAYELPKFMPMIVAGWSDPVGELIDARGREIFTGAGGVRNNHGHPARYNMGTICT